MTNIEAGYIAQGYELPRGWTWERVSDARRAYDIGAIYVPVASAAGVLAWGVPMMDGKFMSHDA